MQNWEEKDGSRNVEKAGDVESTRGKSELQMNLYGRAGSKATRSTDSRSECARQASQLVFKLPANALVS